MNTWLTLTIDCGSRAADEAVIVGDERVRRPAGIVRANLREPIRLECNMGFGSPWAASRLRRDLTTATLCQLFWLGAGAEAPTKLTRERKVDAAPPVTVHLGR